MASLSGSGIPDTRDPIMMRKMFDEATPVYEYLIYQYYQALVNPKYRPGLEEKWVNNCNGRRAQLKTFAPEWGFTDRKQTTSNTQTASARIMFEGKKETFPDDPLY